MNIVEEPNRYYKINPIRMANDEKIKGVKDPLPDFYNHFMIICGKPGVGKSTYWINMLTKKNKTKSTYYGKFDRVEIFSNSLKTITSKIHLPEERLHHGIDDLESVVQDIAENTEEDEEGNKDKTLIVLDDVASDLKHKEKDFLEKLVWNRRHTGGGITIWLCVQVFNSVDMKLRKNISHIAIWNTSNKQELESIYKNTINMNKDKFYELLRYVYKDNHDFLFIDVDTRTYYRNFNKLVFNSD
jgi:Cdc6-like AAA superfamily ATPase